jgi:hypothetical protein
MAVFCDRFLEISATSVVAQGEPLLRFTPLYAGSRMVPGSEVPCERRMVLNHGGVGVRAGSADQADRGGHPDRMGGRSAPALS